VGRRLGRLLCIAVIVAVAAPAFGVTTSRKVQCAGRIRPGRRASCTTWFSIPHFNANDSIDTDHLVAKIISPDASQWRVSGTIYDARGVAYFAWYCSASRSSNTVAFGTYAGHSCAASRKTVRVRRGGRYVTQYYVANTSAKQRLVVSAVVGACAPTTLHGCRYQASATYQLSR